MNAMPQVKELNGEPIVEPPHGVNIPLAKSLIPIAKLLRLFLKKLSTCGINQKPLPSYMEMCSYELQMLHDTPQDVVLPLGFLAGATGRANEPCTFITDFIQRTHQVLAVLHCCMAHVVLCVIPLIPDTTVFPVQKSFKAWFIT
ncbi:hypothetical protein PSHT_06917 [Puccinia striiformis]|nr:hypothetical protein PSHT_06917 [Puccinia striiformis]